MVKETLKRLGYRSLMVEGGQKVISSYLSSTNKRIVDRIIITIAPVLVGKNGTAATSETNSDVSLRSP
jgi:2,5-diamino-6-(ribosylamino)-4(3H)-pyrimidinone 5'-phosphate reductase